MSKKYLSKTEWCSVHEDRLVSLYGNALVVVRYPKVPKGLNRVTLYCPDHKVEQDVLLKSFTNSGANGFTGLTCCKNSQGLKLVQNFFSESKTIILDLPIENTLSARKGSTDYVSYTCKIHGEKHTCLLYTLASKLRAGSYNPPCCVKASTSPYNDVPKYIETIKGSKLVSVSGIQHSVRIVGPSKGILTKLRIKCNEHGTVTDHVLGEFTRKRPNYLLKCCSNIHRTRTYEEWYSSIQHDKLSTNGQEYSYAKVCKSSVASTDRVTITCPEHGDREVYAFSHLTSKLICCARENNQARIRLTETEVLTALKAHSPQHEYTVLSTAASYGDWKIQVRCNDHGTSLIDTKAKNTLSQTLRYGNFCPDCTKLFMSGVEAEFSLRLEKEFPSTVFRTNVWLKGFGSKRLDFYSKEYKLGIEINGVYWHSEDKKGKRAHSDKRKWLLARGVTLLQFTDLEIQQKPDLIISMLKSRMGKNKVLYARKTKVKKLETSDAKKFFNENHISGFLPSKLYVGLVYEDKIVSMASFSKARFSTNNNYDFELIRFATLRGLTVVGGLSKLVSAFKSRYTGVLVSYADLRYGNGNAYEKAGFTKLRENAPGYGYFRALKYVSRYQAQKHKLPKLLGEGFDPSKSESENMLANKWRKIYDAGSLVFILKC